MSRLIRPFLIGRTPGASAGWSVVALGVLVCGCQPTTESPTLTVATAWPLDLREEFAEAFREDVGTLPVIQWVSLEPEAAISWAIDRRAGIDVLLGGLVEDHDRLARQGRLVAIDPLDAIPWQTASRPGSTNPDSSAGDERNFADPRVHPAALGRFKALIAEEGWSRGYETLVRQAARSRLGIVLSSVPTRPPAAWPLEAISIPIGGKNLVEARHFVELLERRGVVSKASRRSIDEARADGLLADLLGSALVDSQLELRQANAALARFGHPERLLVTLGEPPPWPPASVARLLSNPKGEPMVETLLDQIAPDPESRAWLVESWSKPKRPIDGRLLADLADFAGGRLALEPRFRAWLKGEWTAWTRQHYRRVARVAGGSIPS